MISTFIIKNFLLFKIKYNKDNFLNYFWIDILNKKNICNELKISNKTKYIINNILNINNKFIIFKKNNNFIYIKLLFFNYKKLDYCKLIFIINNNKLISIKNKNFNLFYNYLFLYKKSKLNSKNVYELIYKLFNSNLININNIINIIDLKINNYEKILIKNENYYEEGIIIKNLIKHKNILYKIQSFILDFKEILFFLKFKNNLDIKKINSKINFKITDNIFNNNKLIIEKINFLIQMNIEYLNIKQNRIVKIFSVISTIFLPPTLIASSYGMNFLYIPELKWKLGYFFALFLMILSSIIPYIFFKKKKWI